MGWFLYFLSCVTILSSGFTEEEVKRGWGREGERVWTRGDSGSKKEMME